jgi:ABC-type amino acid transport substrate-binding protein
MVKLKFFLFVLSIAIVFHSMATAQDEIVLTSTEFPPYESKTLPNYGFVSEIVKTAFERIGHKVKVLFVPFERSIKMAQQGSVDGTYAIWYSKERELDFVFSDPLSSSSIVFYKRHDKSIDFGGQYDKLKEHTIGVVQGYINPPEFEKAHYLKQYKVKSEVQNLQMLFHGRIDLMLVDKLLAQHLINTKFPHYNNILVPMTTKLKEDILYLAISRKTNNYQKKISDFNEGLKQITKDGTIKKIIAKHKQSYD